MNNNKHQSFIKNYYNIIKKSNKLSDSELWKEVEELVTYHRLSKDDLLYILNNENISFDKGKYLKDFWKYMEE